METAISVKKLKKDYGNFTAVNGISFEVYRGEVFGLLGENGAGKTTTLEIIEGLRQKTAGDITVLGHPLAELSSIKEKIGIQLQSSAYYDFLTLREILDLFGSFYQKQQDADQLLQLVDLSEKANSYLNTLSGGQKQRFSIVASLVNDPQIVFLDEPTTGLDPLARRNVWELIEHIKSQKKTIILTTHYMEEAERLCDRIAIMDAGEIKVIGHTPELLEKLPYPHTLAFAVKSLEVKDEKKLSALGKLNKEEQGFVLKLTSRDDLTQAIKLIMPLNPLDLRVSHANLEDLFIELTGKTLVNS